MVYMWEDVGQIIYEDINNNINMISGTIPAWYWQNIRIGVGGWMFGYVEKKKLFFLDQIMFVLYHAPLSFSLKCEKTEM